MNKKKIFLAVAIAAIVMVSGLNISRSMNDSTPVSDMELANIEALAQDEGGGGTVCHDTITTAVAQQVLYCGTCTYIAGKPSTYSSSKKC
jgi:hypothetical protein